MWVMVYVLGYIFVGAIIGAAHGRLCGIGDPFEGGVVGEPSPMAVGVFWPVAVGIIGPIALMWLGIRMTDYAIGASANAVKQIKTREKDADEGSLSIAAGSDGELSHATKEATNE